MRYKAIVILICFMTSALVVDAQRKKKVYSYQEGMEFSYNRNLDNSKGVPMANLYRDDLLYHSESAYVTPKDRANVSLLKYSRMGLGKDWEISTNIGEDAFRPIVGGKYQWAQWGKINMISSYITLSTIYPGMVFAKKWGLDKIIAPREKRVQVGEFGHELIYSHVWSYDPNCSTGNPYLVMTFSMGNYWGMKFNGGEMRPMAYHILAQRSTTYCRSGFRMHIKGWLDGYITSWMTMHGGLFMQLAPGLKHPASLEARGEVEIFLSPRLSVSLGGLGSVGNFEGVKTKAMGYPMFDISFYIGKKQSMSGLFDLKL